MGGNGRLQCCWTGQWLAAQLVRCEASKELHNYTISLCQREDNFCARVIGDVQLITPITQLHKFAKTAPKAKTNSTLTLLCCSTAYFELGVLPAKFSAPQHRASFSMHVIQYFGFDVGK